MKYLIIIFSFFVSFASFADPRVGGDVHWPYSKDDADQEDKCEGCVGHYEQGTGGNAAYGFASMTVLMDRNLAVSLPSEISSETSDFTCALVDPDNGNETRVPFWKATYNVLSCETEWCEVDRRMKCAIQAWYVFP